MTVDLPQKNVASPPEIVLPDRETLLASLLSTAVMENYEVLSVMPSQTTDITLRLRQRAAGDLAELRFKPRPPPSAMLETRRAEEAERLWIHNVAGWTRALRLTKELGGHPHIQRLLDFGEVETGFYVLLEHSEGQTLRQVLEASGSQTLEWTLPLCTQIASALDFAATYNVWHGGLTPDNIVFSNPPSNNSSDLLSNDSSNNSSDIISNRPDSALHGNTLDGNITVRLRNFGLSSLQPNVLTEYMSPEQTALQEGDTRSDIYALGALLYTCLSGRPPFTAVSREELCRKIQTTSPLPLLGQQTWRRDIIAHAMQRAPEYRYRVAVDIVTDLILQRSPASFKLDVSPDAHAQDCSLGHFMPGLALVEDSADSAASFYKPNITRFQSRREKADNAKTKRLLYKELKAKAKKELKEDKERSRSRSGSTSGRDPADLPVHGLLGRFNRYMALQEYVLLNAEDPAWRGWRGLLRRVGLRLPASADSTSRLRRFQLPWWLTRRLESLWRVARIAVPLAILALCLHAGQRVRQHGRVWVFQIKGHPMIEREGKKIPLHTGDILDGVDAPLLITDKDSELTLDLADSRLELAPDSTLHITQLSYNGARQRRLELLNGQLQTTIASEAERDLPGRYDIWCQDIQIRALPADAPTTLSLSTKHGRARVRLASGQARLSSQGTRRFMQAGQQLTAQTGKPLPHPMALSIKDSRELAALTASRQRSALPSLIAHWLGLYTNAQEKTLMPFADQAMTWCKLKPGAQSALDEARAFATARISMDAIVKTLAGNDMPVTLDLQTLQETGLETKDRDRMLKTFADHRLLAYQHLENGSCILLARVNNENKTLLKAHDGLVTVVPEAQEDVEIGKIKTD